MPASVVASEQQVLDWLAPIHDHYDIAATLGSHETHIAVRDQAVDRVAAALSKADATWEPLPALRPFQTRFMEPVLVPLAKAAKETEWQPPRLAYMGSAGLAEQATTTYAEASYWASLPTQPLRMLAGGNSWSALAGQVLLLHDHDKRLLETLQEVAPEVIGVPAFDGSDDTWSGLTSALAELACRGVAIDWEGFDRELLDDGSLPCYPFERQRYWMGQQDPSPNSAPAVESRTLPPQSQSASQPPRPRRTEVELRGMLEQWLRQLFADVLKLSASEIEPHARHMELGLDSIMATRLARLIDTRLNIGLDATLLFAYPTIADLADYLTTEHHSACRAALVLAPDQVEAETRHHDETEQPLTRSTPAIPLPSHDAIAIVGLGVRFAGASTPDQLWHCFRNGIEAVRPLPEQRRGRIDRDSRHVTWRDGGYLDDVAGFDAEFFGISPREARLMDPQQRIFLEVAHEAVEQAGYTTDDLANLRTSVFVGVSQVEYARLLDRAGIRHEAHLGSGSSLTMVANRVSFLFDWTGPSLAIDTACSSSLVALHMACESLLRGETDAALAGGVNLILTSILPNRWTRPACWPATILQNFRPASRWLCAWRGSAALLLKPLSAALRDGDTIWGVVRGTAVNHDGRDKVAVTAPNPHAQLEVMRAAYRRAGLTPEDISLVEAHGTGTRLGDPIEFNALRTIFEKAHVVRGSVALGSAKTVVGHLEAAAGMAGVLRAVLALAHRELPPSLHLQTPNALLDVAGSPFFLNDRPRAWQGDEPRRAVVSSFGAGGTNAHAILEAAPTQKSPHDYSSKRLPPLLLQLSARTELGLQTLVRQWQQVLNSPAATSLSDLCWMANCARGDHAHRLALVVRYRDQLFDKLEPLRDWGRRDALTGSQIYYGSPLTGTSAQARYRERVEPRVARLSDAVRAALAQYCSGPRFESWHQPPTENSASQTLGDDEWVELLTVVAELYTLGVSVDWRALHGQRPAQRLAVPTYPFAHQDYWFAQSDNVIAKKPSGAADWLWQFAWHECPLSDTQVPLDETYLIFHANDPLSTAVVQSLRQANQSLVEVVPGEAFAWDETTRRAALQPNRLEDYKKLLSRLLTADIRPTQILHLWGISNDTAGGLTDEEVETRIARTSKSCLALLQACESHGELRQTRLVVATSNSQAVLSVDRCANYPAAGVWGLLRVAALEQPGRKFHCVDFDTDAIARPEDTARRLLEELRPTNSQGESAWRGTKRYVSQPAPLQVDRTALPQSLLRERGTYLITGGLGGVGLELAAWLTKHLHARVILLGRTPLPAQHTWNDWLASHPADDPTSRRMRAIQLLQSSGSPIHLLAADVTHRESLNHAWQQAQAIAGRIDGVFHAAGITRDRLLASKSFQEFDDVLRTKLDSTRLLDQLLRDEPVEFLCLFSSLAGVVGNIGQADYAAANRLLDSFAHWRASQHRTTKVIDWTLWNNVGLGAEYADLARRRGIEPIAASTACEALDRVLRLPHTQVIVARWQADPGVVSQAPLPTSHQPQASLAKSKSDSSSPPIALVDLFAEALECPTSHIELSRPVVEMGVDSLISARIVRALREASGCELPATLLFDHGTITRLAQPCESSTTSPCNSNRKIRPSWSTSQPLSNNLSHHLPPRSQAVSPSP